MKICFAISTSYTSFKFVGQGEWEKNAMLMSQLKYHGIELAIRNPVDIHVLQLEKVFTKLNLKLAAIGTGQAYLEEGLSLTNDDENIRLKTVNRLKEHVDLASMFDSPVVVGLIRGVLGRLPEDRQRRFNYFKNAFRQVVDYAKAKNVSLLIEPLNRYESDFFNSAQETMDFIAKMRYTNVGLLLDTFHMNIEEKDILKTISKSRKYLKHVHIADSNRQFPGQGHIDFVSIFKTLKKINYKGFVSGEMLPYPDLKTSIGQYRKRMKEVVHE